MPIQKNVAAFVGAIALVSPALAADSKPPHPAPTQHALQLPTQLNPEEIKKLMRQFDGNGDGKLDDAERKAIFGALEKFQKKNPEQVKQVLEKIGHQLNGMPNPPPGQSPQEILDKVQKQFDHNGNGELSPQERAAAKQAKELHDRQQANKNKPHDTQPGKKTSQPDLREKGTPRKTPSDKPNGSKPKPGTSGKNGNIKNSSTNANGKPAAGALHASNSKPGGGMPSSKSGHSGGKPNTSKGH